MIGIVRVNIFMFADDIILLAPSVGAMQSLLYLCEQQLANLDMALNAKNLFVFVLVLGTKMTALR